MEVEEKNKKVNKYADINKFDFKSEQMINSVRHSHKVIKKILQSHYQKEKYDKHNRYSVYLLKRIKRI